MQTQEYIAWILITDDFFSPKHLQVNERSRETNIQYVKFWGHFIFKCKIESITETINMHKSNDVDVQIML